MLAHVLKHAAASMLDEVILVLGHQAERISAAVGEWGQRVVVNREYATGQSTSLRAGLVAINPDAAAVVFLLGDQPQVLPRTIDALIDAFRTCAASIVLPTYDGVDGHPILIARPLFAELQSVSGDRGARDVIRSHSDAVLQVPVSGTLPRDVDTEEDYAALLAGWPAGDDIALLGDPGLS